MVSSPTCAMMTIMMYLAIFKICSLFGSAGADGTVVLKIGVVMGPCNDTCDSQTSVKSVSSWNDIIEATVTWAYVDLSEIYLVLSEVKEMCERDVDLVILTSDVTYDLHPAHISSHCRSKLMQWAAPGVTRDVNQQSDVIQSSYKIDGLTPHQYNSTGHLFADIVSSLTGHLKWTSTVVLVDAVNDDVVDSLAYGLSRAGVSVVDGTLPDIRSPNFQQKFLSLLDYAIEHLPNITLVCSMDCVKTILEKPFSIERWEVHRYAMRHMTRWLIVTFGNDSADTLDVATDLDNVAVIVLPNTVTRKHAFSKVAVMHYIRQVLNDVGSKWNTTDMDTLRTTAVQAMSNTLTSCQWVPIETLMWTASGRRFQAVGYIDGSGHLMTSGEIFPNEKLGFNRREFLVSTNTWPPFVTKHEDDTFSGFCIDLLDHLAESLNFTYRLTMPADGAWGLLLKNGHFNGLVGQMERNEVDLIVAPVSIQTNREKVMDFSYPFYYEPTKLLLRKMDPTDTKWRSLIDPFTTTVLICIGVSLPITSFVLYMLERVSPYYRNVEDRAAMRGLHHFSDCFWYLYGALLTQGGEHMSESISGRTLLSFWWLFSIAVMATYSGNLIAFMAISKDKVPFDSISGMVNRDDYTWGLVGGTALLNILETSSHSDFHKVWEGIVRFNRTDPDILSPDPALHVQKILDGKKYGYLGDKTYIEIEMVKECDLVTTKEEFVPLQYAVALPNNSPFSKTFSDQVLTTHASGLFQIWKAKHWPSRNTCLGKLFPSATIIRLGDLQSAFYLIGIGLVMAFLVLFYECTFSHWKKHRRRELHSHSVNTANVIEIA